MIAKTDFLIRQLEKIYKGHWLASSDVGTGFIRANYEDTELFVNSSVSSELVAVYREISCCFMK